MQEGYLRKSSCIDIYSKVTMLKILLTILLFGCIQACNQRITENGIVCVCDATYCDTVPDLDVVFDKDIQIFYTSAKEPGFNIKKAEFTNINLKDDPPIIQIVGNQHQQIIGFGGAFTDSTGQNIKTLSEDAQQKLLESYFGESGIGYSVCRVPIGGTDFSPKAYTYDDHDGDIELKYWKLQDEDFNYKISMIKKAMDLRGNNPLKLFASAWTAPPWMKTNHVWSGGFTMLQKEYYQLWTDYTIKFFDAYKEQGISFWGLTTGNEPQNGFYINNGLVTMGWVTTDQANWIADSLGPTLRNSDHKDIKIMIHDDGSNVLPYIVPTLLNDTRVLDVIDGIATHWYYDSNSPPEIRNLLKTDKKDLFLLSTESCYFITNPLLGSWKRASGYISSIVSYMNYDFGGWVDWNMVLNYTGGFSHQNVQADSPIIVSEDSTEFYKQPLFYAMGHFSKFILPDSVRIEATQDVPNLETLAFVRPDDLKVVVVFNSGDNDVNVQLLDDSGKKSETLSISANSINTMVYKK